jgi:spermidine/putrescine transport system ATP-binding protein
MADIDVCVTNLSKHFGSFIAVNSVNFEVPKGSFFSILGPSGSGKTTLMRMIAGFIEPTIGEIYIGGELVNRLPANKRRTNMVFQNLALFPMMNVFDNIAFGLHRRHVPQKDISRRVNAILERVDMPGMGERRIEQLSGGQKQRIALARCLVLEPTVLILDEPLGALDLKLRESMKLELKRLQERTGTTFLYVTHDQSEALIMSNQIAVMNKGNFEQIGTPSEIYRNPSTYFVAMFVGEANRLTGRVITSSGNKSKVEISSITFAARNGEPVKPGDEVDIFIRPEAISIFSQNDGGAIRGSIIESIFEGAYSRFVVQVQLGSSLSILRVTVPEGSVSQNYQVGDQVSINWESDTPIIFLKPDRTI